MSKLKANKTGKRSPIVVRRVVRMPRRVWGVFDPQGKLRSLHINQPHKYAIAWPYVADDPHRYNGGIETPTDYLAAKRDGYRIVPMLLAHPNDPDQR